MDNKIEMGGDVKDEITGFSGVVTAIADYINGCQRVQVTSKKLEGGEVREDWFDVQRLRAIGKPRSEVSRPIPTGGPRNSPSRSNPPHRPVPASFRKGG